MRPYHQLLKGVTNEYLLYWTLVADKLWLFIAGNSIMRYYSSLVEAEWIDQFSLIASAARQVANKTWCMMGM